jgi:hypothetical protein
VYSAALLAQAALSSCSLVFPPMVNVRRHVSYQNGQPHDHAGVKFSRHL